MLKHTAGTWHRGVGNGEGSIFADEGRIRCENGGTVLYPICTMVTGYNEEEDEANARLIAAAPDLLKALEQLAVHCGGKKFMTDNLDPTISIEALLIEARNAIKRVKGVPT